MLLRSNSLILIPFGDECRRWALHKISKWISQLLLSCRCRCVPSMLHRCFGRAKRLPNPTAESGPRWFFMLPWLLQTFTKNPTQRLIRSGLRWPEGLTWVKPNIGTFVSPTHFPQQIHLWDEINYLQRHLTPPPPPASETSSCFLFSPFWRTVRSLFPMGGLGIPSGWKRFKASRVGVRTQLLATSLEGRPLSSALFLLLFGASCTKHARKFVGTFSTRQCIWRFFQWLATCWFEQIPCPSRLHPTSYQVLVLQWVKQTNVAQIYHTNLSGSRWCLASWDKPLINQRNPAPETTEHF